MTAVATTNSRAVIALLNREDARRAIEPLLSEGVTYERVIREVYLAASDNADILGCSNESIIRAVCKAVSWGLVIGETVHLVPFGRTLKAMQDYKGKIELMVRYRAARFIDAQPVYENEPYRFALGTSPFVEHTPLMDSAKRGRLVGAYAYAKISAYDLKVVVLTADEIDKIRKKHSKQWKSGELGDIPWYACKTAVHRLAKQIPKSEALARALEQDDDAEADERDEREGTSLPSGDDVPPPRGVQSPTLTGAPHLFSSLPAGDPYGDPQPPGEREPGDEEEPPIPF